MPKDPKKEEADLSKLDHFRQLHAVPEGRIDSKDESPDLVIHSLEQRIGIEITDIHHGRGKGGSKVKQVQSELAQVMRLLKKRLDSLGVPPVNVRYHGSGPTLTSGGQNDLAERLARYIVTRLPEPGEVFSKCSNHWPYDPEMPPEIFALSVARGCRLTQTSCHAPRGVAVPELTAADVLSGLEDKNGNVERYLKRCDEPWLLLCINTPDISTAYSLDTFQVPDLVRTSFGRVFVMSIREPRVYELPCVRPSDD